MPAYLDINDGYFTIQEFRKVKAYLQLRKAAGPDIILPEGFKNCDFDEICLEFCNKALKENDKLDKHHSSAQVRWPVY